MKKVFGMNETCRANNQRGVALLAVLWLTVALSFMGMTTSYLVRTEIESVSNRIEAQRSYYLARGGIEAAIYSIVHSPRTPVTDPGVDGRPGDYRPGQRRLDYKFPSEEFPGGFSQVEVVPENAKLNINLATPEQLAALFFSLGLPADRSLEMAAAIVDWRSPRTSDVGSLFDLFYSSLPRPYTARHAPLEHMEELLPAKGMSRSLFFGRVEYNPEDRLRKWPPLADLLTAQPAGSAVNPNFAPYEVLRVLPGWNDAMAASAVAARTAAPFRSMEELRIAVPETSTVVGLAPLTLAQGPVYTLTATGSLPGSGVRRSVRALVRVGPNLPLYHQVLAWWNDWPFQIASHQPEQADVGTRRGIRR